MAPRAYNPTPEQIRATCQAIQLEWSDAERSRRAMQPEHPETRVVRTPQFSRIVSAPSGKPEIVAFPPTG